MVAVGIVGPECHSPGDCQTASPHMMPLQLYSSRARHHMLWTPGSSEHTSSPLCPPTWKRRVKEAHSGDSYIQSVCCPAQLQWSTKAASAHPMTPTAPGTRGGRKGKGAPGGDGKKRGRIPMHGGGGGINMWVGRVGRLNSEGAAGGQPWVPDGLAMPLALNLFKIICANSAVP